MVHDDKNYLSHWDEKFSSGNWGKYPNEELVRFVCGTFNKEYSRNNHVLEIGCGTGANLWFLHNEGHRVHGIDCSPHGIAQAKESILKIGGDCDDIKVGNFSNLPWPDNTFDLVVDVFALYANTPDAIDKTIKEVARVMKVGSYFFTMLWGTETRGFGTGTALGRNTFTDITGGPCENMGVSCFFDKNTIEGGFRPLELIKQTEISRTINAENYSQELICVFKK
jgi:SAM-dependent methyltransferase